MIPESQGLQEFEGSTMSAAPNQKPPVGNMSLDISQPGPVLTDNVINKGPSPFGPIGLSGSSPTPSAPAANLTASPTPAINLDKPSSQGMPSQGQGAAQLSPLNLDAKQSPPSALKATEPQAPKMPDINPAALTTPEISVPGKAAADPSKGALPTKQGPDGVSDSVSNFRNLVLPTVQSAPAVAPSQGADPLKAVMPVKEGPAINSGVKMPEVVPSVANNPAPFPTAKVDQQKETSATLPKGPEKNLPTLPQVEQGAPRGVVPPPGQQPQREARSNAPSAVELFLKQLAEFTQGDRNRAQDWKKNMRSVTATTTGKRAEVEVVQQQKMQDRNDRNDASQARALPSYSRSMPTAA